MLQYKRNDKEDAGARRDMPKSQKRSEAGKKLPVYKKSRTKNRKWSFARLFMYT